MLIDRSEYYDFSLFSRVMVSGSNVLTKRSNLRSDQTNGDSVINSKQQLPQEPEPRHQKHSRLVPVNEQQYARKRQRIEHTTRDHQLKVALRARENSGASALPPVLQPQLAANAVQASVPNPPTTVPSKRKILFEPVQHHTEIPNNGGVVKVVKTEKRTLRSHDGGSRVKSELAQYLPNFEQMLSLEPIQKEPLNIETRIILIDDLSTSSSSIKHDGRIRPPDPNLFGTHKPLHNVRLIDLDTLVTSSPSSPRRSRALLSQPLEEPLPAAFFEKAHRRHERNEKQQKNIELDKSAHDKVQMERLLAELKGPDWLKVLGISGITDTEKKLYEPKRLLFIREVKSQLDKYDNYKAEEKRRKLEKEEEARQAAFEEQEAEYADSEEDIAESEDGRQSTMPTSSASPRFKRAQEMSDVDTLAAIQLLTEANNVATSKKKGKSKAMTFKHIPFVEPPAYVPFTSFYEKRHIRDASLNGSRRGRNISAFGQSVPEFDHEDFDLPEDFITEDEIRASQRRRRARNRGSSPA